MPKKANLFIVGEPKSGTSALYALLSQHPGIYMSPEKEPFYFCKDIQEESRVFHGKNLYFHHENIESYSTLFEGAKNEPIRGEASTIYLYSKVAAQEIHNYNPEAKIIMMFREPLAFLHSLHSQYLSEMTETEEDFIKALSLEKERKMHRAIDPRSRLRAPSFLYYRARANYLEHLKRYLEIFDKNQIMVIIFEDFQKDNAKILRKILNFLETDDDFKFEYKNINKNKVVRGWFLYRFAQSPKIKLFFWKTLPPRAYYSIKRWIERIFFRYKEREPLDAALKNYLKETFQPQVAELDQFLREEKLVDVNLLETWGYQ